MAVPALGIHRTQAVQDSASGVLEIRESLDGLSRLPAASDRFTLHGGGLVAITHDLSDSLGWIGRDPGAIRMNSTSVSNLAVARSFVVTWGREVVNQRKASE